jgi:hypothetical protein
MPGKASVGALSRAAASGLSEVFLARQRRRKSWNSGLHEWASLRSGMPLVVIKKRAWVFHTRGGKRLKLLSSQLSEELSHIP